MKKQLKTALLSLLGLITLASCGGNEPSSSTSDTTPSNPSDTTTEPEDPLAKYDFDFHGLKDEDPYEANNISFGGILEDIRLGMWLAAENEEVEKYEFKISFENAEDQSFTVEIDDESILTYGTETINGKVTHMLYPHKTGGTTLKIYDANHTLIYRHIVNCRVAVTDVDIMLEQLYKADRWKGVVFNSPYNNYSMTFDYSMETGKYTSVSLYAVEQNVDKGITPFEINPDTATISRLDSFHTLEFECTPTANTEIKPVTLAVSLSLDVMYLSDSMMLIDLFRPVYETL